MSAASLRPPWAAVAAALLFLLPASAAAESVAPLTLERALALAASRNERARIADENVAAAKARVAQARSLFFPRLTLSADYTRQPEVRAQTGLVVEGPNVFTGRIAAGVTLFDASAFPLYREAKRERDAVVFLSANERRALAFETADAFLVVLGAEQVHAAAERRVELARKNHEDTKARVAAGLVSSNDMTRAALELATAEREELRTRTDAATTRQDLGLLVDDPTAGELAPPSSLLEAATTAGGDPGTLVADARRRRLDLRGRQAQAQAAAEAALEPMRRFIPSVDLAGGYTATKEPDLIVDDTWFVQLLVRWELFDGGRRFAERDERQALASIANLETRALARRVGVDVKQALVKLGSAREAVGRADQAVVLAKKNVDETTSLYKQGLRGSLDVVDASGRLFESEVALVRERYGLGLAMLDLRAAVGLDPLGQEPSIR